MRRIETYDKAKMKPPAIEFRQIQRLSLLRIDFCQNQQNQGEKDGDMFEKLQNLNEDTITKRC